MVGLDLRLNVEGAGAVARAVGDLRSAKAAGGGGDVDGFEETRLTGAVAAQEEMRAGTGLPGEGLQVPEVADGEASEQRSGPGSEPVRSASA